MPDGWAKMKNVGKYAGIPERTFRSWLKEGLRHAGLPSGTILLKRLISRKREKSLLTGFSNVLMRYRGNPEKRSLGSKMMDR